MYVQTAYNLNFCFSGYEVKEALRAQMEVQSKLHLQVEVKILIPDIKIGIDDGFGLVP